MIKAKIGFVGAGKSSMPHYRSFTPLIPEDVRMDFEGMGLYGESLYEIADKRETIVRRVKEMAAELDWQGVIITGAPTEVLNPGLYGAVEAALPIPFTTALHACVAALRVYSAKRVLLLTPFDPRLNDLICQHLEKAGVSAVAPHPFQELELGVRPSFLDNLGRVTPSASWSDSAARSVIHATCLRSGLFSSRALKDRRYECLVLNFSEPPGLERGNSILFKGLSTSGKRVSV